MGNKIKKVKLGNLIVALSLLLPNLAFAQENKTVIELPAWQFLSAIFIAGVAWGTVLLTIRTIKKDIKPLNAIKNAVIEIQTIFSQKGILLQHCLYETSGSPLMPTQTGMSNLIKYKILDVLDDNKELLINKLKSKLKEGYNEFDVQEQARLLIIELIDEPIMNPVKKYAYDEGIPLNEVKSLLKTAGLLLRDDFLNIPRRIKEE